MNGQNHLINKTKKVSIDEEKCRALLSEYQSTLWRSGASSEEKENTAKKCLLLYRFLIHSQQVALRTKRAIRGAFEEVLYDLLELGHFKSYRDLQMDVEEFTDDDQEIIDNILSEIETKHSDYDDSSSQGSEALHGYLNLKDIRYYYDHIGIHSILKK